MIKNILYFLVSFTLGFGLIYAVMTFVAGSGGSPSYTGQTVANAKTILWKDLRQLDYKTGEKPEELAALDNEIIRIPGFVVPLDDNDTGLSEFLLVPSPQACIHVPPPPPNSMILVKMESNKTPKREWGPIWLTGKLKITETKSEFGKVSYQLSGLATEPFKY